MGVSPSLVFLVRAKIFTESLAMSPTTRIGCCLSTLYPSWVCIGKVLISWPSWTLTGMYTERGAPESLTSPSTPRVAATEGLGHSGRSSAGGCMRGPAAAGRAPPHKDAPPPVEHSYPNRPTPAG